MLHDCGRLLDSNDHLYTYSDFSEKCYNQLTCCVCFDSDIKSDRCCNCQRETKDQPDYFDCGSKEEDRNMKADGGLLSPAQTHKKKTLRFVRWALRISGLVSIFIGLSMVIFPRLLLLNVVVEREYHDHFQVKVDVYEELEKKLKKLDTIENPEVNILMKVFNQYFSSPQATEKDKNDILRELSLLDKEIQKDHPEEVMMTSPTILCGSFVLFHAALSCVQYFNLASNTLKKGFKFDSSVPHTQILWFVFSAIGCAVAVAGSGRGMTSSHFSLLWLVYNAIFIFVWFYVREKINHYDMLLLQSNNNINNNNLSSSSKNNIKNNNDNENDSDIESS